MSLEALAAKGPIFDDPVPAIHLLLSAYRELIGAQAASSAVDVARLSRLLMFVLEAPSDIHLLAPLCALAEATLRVGARDLSAECEPIIRRAHENGIVFTAGWVQSIPRLLAGCASAAGRIDEAEIWYERAVAAARTAPARIELAVALVGRARFGSERGDLEDDSSCRADLAEALSIANEFALLPLAKEAEQVVASLKR